MSSSRRVGAAVAGLAALFGARLLLAWELPLVADEAYFWTWSRRLAAGYFDQPPLVAGLVAAGEWLGGRSELALRSLFLGCGLIATLTLWTRVRDRSLWVLWSALPVFFGLTTLAVPDAPLLAAWSVAVAGALRGGAGWWLAGLASGLGFQAKYSGLAVFPLLVIASGDGAWRSRWVALGAATHVAIAVPNLLWNAEHGWVSFAFPFREGLAHPQPPGITGLLDFVLAQGLVVGPVLPMAGLAWAVGVWRSLPTDRTLRLAWATSVPVLVGFAVASWFGPTEAHWTAPAWWSLGVGFACSAGRWTRWASVGAWVGAATTLGLILQIHRPIFDLPVDPGSRFREGPALASAVAAWALPEGAAIADGRGSEAVPVITERYQEAALIHYYSGIPATHAPGCGREDEYTRFGAAVAASRIWFVRPHTGGEPTCILGEYPRLIARQTLAPLGPDGGRLGPWDLFELEAVPQ
jgi:4-amino-4-deoxy-L-arabinose transferase-like glycosyltransferase